MLKCAQAIPKPDSKCSYMIIYVDPMPKTFLKPIWGRKKILKHSLHPDSQIYVFECQQSGNS